MPAQWPREAHPRRTSRSRRATLPRSDSKNRAPPTATGAPSRQPLRAHEVVGAMVRRVLSEGRDFSNLTLAEWRDASEMFGEDAPRAATALASVQAKRTPQSTNPESVR